MLQVTDQLTTLDFALDLVLQVPEIVGVVPPILMERAPWPVRLGLLLSRAVEIRAPGHVAFLEDMCGGAIQLGV